jgi:hypothetical protein
MRGEGRSGRQAAVIAVVLAAAVAVPKALADDVNVVPVDGAALAAVAINASTPVVPQAPPTPVVPETGSVSAVSPVIPPPVSPPPPPPPDAGSSVGTPQSPSGEPSGGGSAPAVGPQLPASDSIENATESISSSITAQGRVILRSAAPDKRRQNARGGCRSTASCKVPETHPWEAAAASARGRVRELPPSGVTTGELAHGHKTHEEHKHRKPRQARAPADAGSGQIPLLPEPPGRSPEAPPPSAMTFSSAGAHGTGSFTVSASVTSFGVAAALALSTAARLFSVPLRRRESDDRPDRPG